MYKHRQIGWVIIFLLLVSVVGCVVGGLLMKGSASPSVTARLTLFLVAGMLLICLVLFFSLTVTVEGTKLVLRFAYGPIKKRIDLTQVERFSAVKNPWYYGFGIHWTGKCWVYNVSGRDAVEIILKNGKRYRVGTDDQQGLLQALEQACGKIS